MKFSNYLKSIEDVSIYPLITLVLFVLVFVSVVVYTYMISKEDMDERANIPLK